MSSTIIGVIVALACVFSASALYAVPSGSYCGGVPDIVDIKISVAANLSYVNATATVFDTVKVSCLKEAIQYFPANGTVFLTNIDDPKGNMKETSAFG